MVGSAVATMVWSATARNIGSMIEGKTVRNSDRVDGALSSPTAVSSASSARERSSVGWSACWFIEMRGALQRDRQHHIIGSSRVGATALEKTGRLLGQAECCPAKQLQVPFDLAGFMASAHGAGGVNVTIFRLELYLTVISPTMPSPSWSAQRKS